jgi:hypothetical protein
MPYYYLDLEAREKEITKAEEEKNNWSDSKTASMLDCLFLRNVRFYKFSNLS